MPILAASHSLSRIFPGLEFGDAKDGIETISTTPNTFATVVISAGSPNATLGSAILANGDVFAVHQTQYTGVGFFEFNQVVSGGGTTSIVCKKPFDHSYSTGAQVVRIKRHLNLAVNAHTIQQWNGSTGGIEILAAKNNLNINGAINAVGAGLRGGSGAAADTNNYGNYGENYAGVSGNAGGYGNSGSGGGGGRNTSDNGTNASAGGGGGHINAGVRGGTPPNTNAGGYGGSGGYGSSDLLTLMVGSGGGGGGGAHSNDTGILPHQPGGVGGNGGGILILIGKNITVSAAVNASGGAGGNGGLVYSQLGYNGMSGGGGGGAGGSILVICRTANLGTNNLLADWGAEGATNGGGSYGGYGSIGRIAIHHSSTITGTTNPAYTSISDKTVNETTGGAFLMALM